MQLSKKIPLVASLLLVTLIPPSLAADVEKGKQKSIICASCHGGNGISSSPLWPNLAGQKPAYLEKQLHAFRSGERKDAMMVSMAKPLSDEDIKNLAAYYASLKP